MTMGCSARTGTHSRRRWRMLSCTPTRRTGSTRSGGCTSARSSRTQWATTRGGTPNECSPLSFLEWARGRRARGRCAPLTLREGGAGHHRHLRPSVKGLRRRETGKTAEGAGGAADPTDLRDRLPSAATTLLETKPHSPTPTALLGATTRGAGTTGRVDGGTRGLNPAGIGLETGRSAGPNGLPAALAPQET